MVGAASLPTRPRRSNVPLTWQDNAKIWREKATTRWAKSLYNRSVVPESVPARASNCGIDGQSRSPMQYRCICQPSRTLMQATISCIFRRIDLLENIDLRRKHRSSLPVPGSMDSLLGPHEARSVMKWRTGTLPARVGSSDRTLELVQLS